MSNPNPKEVAACNRKRRFSTRTKAEVNALGRMNDPIRSRRSPIPIYTYRCPVCDGYHLTKKPHRHPDSKLWPTQ
jgi:hypothetical protein